jgi:hypothetical protein
VGADVIDRDLSVQIWFREDRFHRVFDVVHQRAYLIHHAQANLHAGVSYLALMAWMKRGVMEFYLYSPLFAPFIKKYLQINSREIKKGRWLKRPFL